MARLPSPGGDTGNWGNVLNDFLSVSHNTDGTNKWVFNVREHGAKGDGVVDDTKAIQDLINKVRSTRNGGIEFSPGFGAIFYFPPGRYAISSLDFTRMNNIELRGISGASTFYAYKQEGTPKPVIDLTGSSQVRVVGLSIFGCKNGNERPDVVPSVGWLIAASDIPDGHGGNGGDSNANYFENIGGWGYFQVSQFYIYNCVDSVFVMCRPGHLENGKNSFVLTAINEFNVTSIGKEYGIQRTTTGPNKLVANNSFYSGASKGVVLTECANINFFANSFDGQGEYCVKMNGENRHIGFYNSQFTHGYRNADIENSNWLTKGVIYISNGVSHGLTAMNPWINNVVDKRPDININVPFIRATSDAVLRSPNIQGAVSTDLNHGTELIHMEGTGSSVRLEGGIIDLAGRDLVAGGTISKTLLINPGNIVLPAGAINDSK